jgi:hypothetical protein
MLRYLLAALQLCNNQVVRAFYDEIFPCTERYLVCTEEYASNLAA